MTREEFRHEMLRVRRHKELRHTGRIPRQLYNQMYEIAKKKSQAWLHERVVFFMYAFDRTHRWTIKDFQFLITEKSWEVAKAKRAERREAKYQYGLERHNRPRPIDLPETSWEGCNGPPMDLIKEKLYGDS